MDLKGFFCGVFGAISAVFAQIFGGWTFALTVLLILMGIDYVSGLAVAGVFHRSPKSRNGGLESHAGLKGLLRKFFMVCVVVVAHLIDRLLGTNYLRDAVALAFCLNEVISIVENAGLMGVPIPKVLMKGIDVLRSKSAEEERRDVGAPSPTVESRQWTVDSEGASSAQGPQNDKEDDDGTA